MRAGDLLTLEIEKPAAGGRMIARAGGQVVLVARTMPGERVRVRIDRIGKGVAYGTAVDIEHPSPARRTPICEPECGGSLYAHIRYDEQTAIKSAVIGDAFARIAKLPGLPAVAVAASPEAGYRMRARLHIRGGRLGFFNEGSHAICDARATRQLLPETCDAIERAAAATGAGHLERAEVEVSENVDASERAVHFEVDGAGALTEPGGAIDGVTGISVASAGGERTRLLNGDPHVMDTLRIEGASFVLRRHVLAFFQGNRFLLGQLVAHVVGQISDGPGDIVDLYAGVGLFSVAAARARTVAVHAIEGDAAAARDLQVNAAQCGPLVQPVHAPVEDFRLSGTPALSTVLVDPPRTGMSRVALQRAVALNAPRLVYVSCDVATLARDARALVDAGYRLHRLDGFDLFPNTPHVETVAVFDR